MSLRCLLLTAVLLAAAPGEAFHGSPAVRAGMLRASDLILNLDLAAAGAACREILALPQGEAPGRFCLGLVTLAAVEETDDPRPALDRFRADFPRTLRAVEALDAAQPGDPEVKLLLGLAHGTRAAIESERHRYVEALRALRAAHQGFQDALALDPRLADAYYGLGLYNYAIANLPALLRPLVATVLPRADAARGIRELQVVAEHGTYLKMTARMALLRIYVGQERRYAEAYAVGRELLARYPGNPDLYFATAHAASELRRFADAMQVTQRLAAQIATGDPRFRDLVPRHQQLLGKVYMDDGQYNAALDAFDRAIRSPTPPRYRWVTAWAWVRSGMIHDVLGDRDEAMRRYRETLAIQTDGLAGTLARRYLDAPYRGRSQS
ncbi:MAG: tetratricopeptide repeat protein [Candidatus Methylomirabilales bacterium]